MGVVDCEGKFLEDVLVAESGFLEAGMSISLRERLGEEWSGNLSVVNFPSLKADMKAGERRKARRLRLP